MQEWLILGALDSFLLILVRTLGMFLMMPFFGNQNIPRKSKLVLAFFISIVMMQIMDAKATVTASDGISYFIAVASEFLTGWLLGFSVYLIFSALNIAGQFIDAQVGLSMVSVLDPMSQIQFTVTGNLYYFILLFILLMTRTYYYFLQGLKRSFEIIPLGKMSLNYDLYDSMFYLLRDYFMIAMQISLLVFFVMLITNAVLGILARTAPQLNMFVVGFPIKLLLGFLTIFVTFYVFEGLSATVIDRAREGMYDFIRGMGK